MKKIYETEPKPEPKRKPDPEQQPETEKTDWTPLGIIIALIVGLILVGSLLSIIWG